MVVYNPLIRPYLLGGKWHCGGGPLRFLRFRCDTPLNPGHSRSPSRHRPQVGLTLAPSYKAESELARINAPLEKAPQIFKNRAAWLRGSEWRWEQKPSWWSVSIYVDVFMNWASRDKKHPPQNLIRIYSNRLTKNEGVTWTGMLRIGSPLR